MKIKNFLNPQSSPDDQNTNGFINTTIFPLHCLSLQMDFNPARAILAEMVGTFILVLCVCGIIASQQLMRGEVGLMEYAATAGLTVVVVIFCIGPISGAHVNPAVTIAFAIFGHFSWSRVPFYILAQMLGSTLATWAGRSVYGVRADLMATRPVQGCFAAFWVEFFGTFIIMFLSAALICEAHTIGHLSGFVVGIAIGLAVLITGPVSGGSMNPARSLGPAIVSWDFDNIWIYMIAPVVGAIAGVLLYQFLCLKHRPCTATSSPSTVSYLVTP